MWKPGTAKPKSPPPPQEDEEDPPPPKATPKKLSGTTLNMKFMQRSNAVQEPPSEAPLVGEAMDEDSVEEEMDVGIATPVDMYGIGAQLPGRRSFQGFAPTTQEAWHTSYVYHSRSSSGTKRLSDDELLRRYANLQRSVNRVDSNKKKKGKKSQPTSISSGAKRKRKSL